MKTLHEATVCTLICKTYPLDIIVPASFSLEDLIKASKFRTKERLPTLAYQYTIDANNTASLWRSSQCKSGLGQSRCTEDENLITIIGKCNKSSVSNQGAPSVHIYDARPFVNALGNKMKGKGYEDIKHYKNAEIFFLNIDNIHCVRDNYKKMLDVCESLQADKTPNHDENPWYDAIILILKGSVEIIEKSLKKGVNVLVHCSDGWDRTTQLLSLVQIMLDPYFRTIEGFAVLIEKDWISFGHMFKTRNTGKSPSHFEEDRRSPIFIQFLDCVHQLVDQFPYAFEFNQRFLADLGYYSRSGIFGTFLCDSLYELTNNNIHENTTSVWSFFLHYKDHYSSRLRETLKLDKLAPNEITPDINISNVRFWREFFSFKVQTYAVDPKLNIELNTKSDIMSLALETQLNKNKDLVRENQILAQKLAESQFIIEKFAKKLASLDSKFKLDEEFFVVDDQEL